jgi:hypothetical protein
MKKPQKKKKKNSLPCTLVEPLALLNAVADVPFQPSLLCTLWGSTFQAFRSFFHRLQRKTSFLAFSRKKLRFLPVA